MLGRDDWKAFVAGASLPASFVTVAYLVAGFRASGRPGSVRLETDIPVVMAAYGLAAVANRRAVQRWGRDASLAVGAAVGLALSLFGRLVLGYPQKLFGLPPGRAWIVHPVAAVLYAAIFRVVVTPVTESVVSTPS